MLDLLLPHVCLSVRVSGFLKFTVAAMNERELFAMMSYICVIYEAIYTADILTHTVEKAQVGLTAMQQVSAGKGGTERIKNTLKSI